MWFTRMRQIWSGYSGFWNREWMLTLFSIPPNSQEIIIFSNISSIFSDEVAFLQETTVVAFIETFYFHLGLVWSSAASTGCQVMPLSNTTFSVDRRGRKMTFIPTNLLLVDKYYPRLPLEQCTNGRIQNARLAPKPYFQNLHCQQY